MDFTPLPQGLQYGGFWRRFAAFAFDSLILFVLTNGTAFAILGLDAFAARPEIGPALTSAAISLLLPLVYTVGFWRWKGATPGKMAFDLRIVDEESLGRPGTGQLVGRYFAYIASAMVLLFGFIVIAFSRRKQGLHDRLAGTVLVVDRQGVLNTPRLP